MNKLKEYASRFKVWYDGLTSNQKVHVHTIATILSILFLVLGCIIIGKIFFQILVGIVVSIIIYVAIALMWC